MSAQRLVTLIRGQYALPRGMETVYELDRQQHWVFRYWRRATEVVA